VMRDQAFRTAARQLGARMVADAAAHRGVAELEALASGSDTNLAGHSS
jgi:hypothetical protein